MEIQFTFHLLYSTTAFDDNNRASVMNITCKRMGYNQVSNIHKCPSVFPGHSATTTPTGHNEKEKWMTTQYSTMDEITSNITERQIDC